MAVWEEPVRGGYPPEWFVALTGQERNDRFYEVAPLPPVHHLTGCKPVEWGDGTSRCIMPASPWFCSPQGRIPLGALSILADLAFGMAYGGLLPAGGWFTTAELSLTRVRDPAVGGEMVGRGGVIHADDTLGLTEARVYDASGLVAAGTSRLAVFPPPDDLPEIPDPMPAPEPVSYDTPDPWEREPEGTVLDPEVWQEMSGRDVLQAQVAGDLPTPPIGRLTGLQVDAVDDGQATVSLPASEWLATPGGTVQGGFTAMLADTALACAIQTTRERGDSFFPLDIKVNYLRPVFPDGKMVKAVGEVTHRGRSLTVAHATVVNADGKPVATATGSARMETGETG